MTSNREKLQQIQMGDIVQFIWHVGERRETRSGVVNGWHFDKYGRHNLQIGHGDGDKETVVTLASVISRRRIAGADKGIIEWRQEQERGMMPV